MASINFEKGVLKIGKEFYKTQEEKEVQLFSNVIFNEKSPKVLVRGRDSGVYFGELESLENSFLVLKNCRNIYYWEGALSCNDIAKNGIDSGNSKVTAAVEEMVISDMISMMFLSEEIYQRLNDIPVYEI